MKRFLTQHPWSIDADGVLKQLEVNRSTGISEHEVQTRRKSAGYNILRETKKISPVRRFLKQLNNPVVLTLIFATALSLVLREYVDAIAIAVILLLNSTIGYFQEAKAEAAIEALKKLSSPKSRLLRDGETIELPAEEVLPGDILVFEAGDYISADARVILSNQLSLDESVLTGESLPVTKDVKPVSELAALADRTSMVFAGTAVANGSGRAVVSSIGMDTEIGRIAGLLESQGQEATPLQVRLEQVSKKLIAFCGVVIGLVVLLGIFHGDQPLEIVMTAVSLAVAAVPEGLPAVVTLALALAVRRMAKRNAIVRHLPAVETLGAATVICTDKTGTLTTGKMRVREVFMPGGKLLREHDLISSRNLELQRACELMALCSNASLNKNGDSTGDSTEVALLMLAKECQVDLEQLKVRSPRLNEWSFDSNRKRMSVAIGSASNFLIVVKGAPESILPFCKLSSEEHDPIQEILTTLSKKGRRLLAVASKQAASYEDFSGLPAEEVEKDLTFEGIVSLADPPRVESIAAIRECKNAGIKVVMITGDHPVTAQAIANELGITEPEMNEVLTGTDLENLNATELENRVEKTSVYARVSPEHKLRIIEAWKNRNAVVAMTGDGVNDAPALKKASIGVSMGKGGTEVARQASSIILADDNFATIVAGVEEGRGIYGNISRTIQYLLSGNLAEILIMLGAAALGWPTALAPIHLLWINLVTDGLPALALAAEPIPRNMLDKQSGPSSRTLLSRAFYRETILVGSITAVMALIIYGYSLKVNSETEARTHLFTFLVFAELFRSFASRSDIKTFFELGPFSNLYHLAAVSFPIVFQIALHHFEWFREIFKVAPISWTECFVLLGLTLIPVTFLELRKLMRSRTSLNMTAKT